MYILETWGRVMNPIRWESTMRELWMKAAGAWCQLMHPAPMWPVNGRYRCPKCLRSFPVAWEQDERDEQQPAVTRSSTIPVIAAR
jgi:hypothetical protein